MTIKALIVVTDNFEDIETVTPFDIMVRAKINVTIAGLNSIQIKGARGIRITADTTLNKINEDYDALIIPGGPQAENLGRSEELRDLILKMHSKGKLIASICASPAFVLAPTGILNAKKATCFKGLEKHFSSSINYQNSDVVIDGNIITSMGAGTAFKFGLAIVETLVNKEASYKIAKDTLFNK